MPRLLRRLGIPVLILSLLAAYAFLNGRPERRPVDAQGRRLFVADGDTIRVGSETIRLAGLDAVERAQFCLDAQGTSWSCGETASSALTDMLASGGLRCITVERDRYGRTVAHCSATGVADVGAAMVAAGWAIADRGGRYAAQEQQARAARRGIWVGTFDLPGVWRTRHNVLPRQHGQPAVQSAAPPPAQP